MDNISTPECSTTVRKRPSASVMSDEPKRLKLDAQTTTVTPINQTESVKPATELIRNAPLKGVRGKHTVKGKKRLFKQDLTDKLAIEMQQLIPSVLRQFDSTKTLYDFCQLLRLISAGKFPLTNIAFLLLLDVVRWYLVDSTTNMAYREDTLKFWRVVYKLFHGKLLRFMSGSKSIGQVVNKESNKGMYDPQSTQINFAVPDRNTVAQFQPTEVNIPAEVCPGVISQAFTMKDRHKDYVVSVDGKKLAPGLTNDKGDIDLFGYEDGESLQMTKDRLNAEVHETESTREKLSSLSDEEKKNKIETTVHIISKRIRDLRNVYVKQSLALNKFEKEAGTDWRNSKYVYAISSVQAMIFQLKAMISRLLAINNSLLEIGASMNGVSNKFGTSGNVDAFTQENWVSLKDPNDIPERHKNVSEYTRQRSDEWFDFRSQFHVTGSKLFESIGLDTLKRMQIHVDKVIHPNKAQEEIPEDVKQRMEHGTKSEINAVATLAGKVMPFYFPDCKYIEEGSHVIQHQGKPLILISPDGSIGNIDMTCVDAPQRIMACEFKCPVPAVYKTQVHYSIPNRYITQILGEMASMNVPELIYLCWTSESSTVFRVSFDEDLWGLIEAEVIAVYADHSLKRPTRISDAAKTIKNKFRLFQENHVTFMCEIPSLTGSSSQMSQSTDVSPYLFPIPAYETGKECSDNLDNVLLSASTALNDVFQLCRKKATEVLVWLLSDTDRNWNPEIPHSLPVAYAMKGYSLAADPMRHMHDHILQSCHDNGLNVVCSCFDGQWIKLATRDVNDKPLTELQLQRDVWEIATKTKRNTIVHELTTTTIVNDLSTDVIIVKQPNGALSVTCNRLANIMSSVKYVLKRKDSIDKYDNPQTVESAADTLSCLPDEALETIIQTEEMASQILASNINEQISKVQCDDNDNVERLDTNKNLRTQALKLRPRRTPVPDDIFVNIWGSLQSHQKLSVCQRWKEKTLSDVKEIINDSSLVHTLVHDELNVILKETEIIQNQSKFYVRKSWNRTDKANGICRLIGSGEEIIVERTVKKLTSLKECASKVLSANTKSVKKMSLNSAYAALIYQDYLQKMGVYKSLQKQNKGRTRWRNKVVFLSRIQ